MSQLMFLQAINQALREELRRDEKVILMEKTSIPVPSAKPKGFLRNLDLKEL